MATTEPTEPRSHLRQPGLRAGERRWLSVAELARELGLSQMTLYRAIAAGDFPAVRIGRRLVVPARVLEDLAAAALATGSTVDTAEWPGGPAGTRLGGVL